MGRDLSQRALVVANKLLTHTVSPQVQERVNFIHDNILEPEHLTPRAFDVVIDKGLLDSLYMVASESTDEYEVPRKVERSIRRSLVPGGCVVVVSCCISCKDLADRVFCPPNWRLAFDMSSLFNELTACVFRLRLEVREG